LDPFLGSGTTAVAASELDRRFVGIELNADYVAVAEKRMSEETNQMRLFQKDRKEVLT
jgi:DNA modification methylase